MTPKIQAPKPPPPPKMPQSPFDNAPMNKDDMTSMNFKSLISTSPMGLKKAALGAKKTLLGGAK